MLWGDAGGARQRGAGGAPGGIRQSGGRQLPVRLAEVGVPHRRVGVSAWPARGGRLGAPGLGGQAQGYHRGLVLAGGWRHDARGVEGLAPGLPGSQVAAGVRHRLGVDFHVQDVCRHLGLDRQVGWSGGAGRGQVVGRLGCGAFQWFDG